MPRRTKTLIIATAILALVASLWNWVIIPKIFPKVACVIQQTDGTPLKAWGEAACVNNGMPTVVLRVE
jgi:hypothetical protein